MFSPGRCTDIGLEGIGKAKAKHEPGGEKNISLFREEKIRVKKKGMGTHDGGLEDLGKAKCFGSMLKRVALGLGTQLRNY